MFVVTHVHLCSTHVSVHACVHNGDEPGREVENVDQVGFFNKEAREGLIIKGTGNSVREQRGRVGGVWGPALQVAEQQVQRL